MTTEETVTEDSSNTELQGDTETANPLQDKYGGDVDKLNNAYAEQNKTITQLQQQVADATKGATQEDDKLDPVTDDDSSNDKSADKDETTEGQLENYEEVVESYGQGMADIFQAAGMDPFPEWQHFDANGTLTDEGYDKLEKVGYDKDTVNTYLDGYAADRDSKVSEVIETLGGEQSARQVQQWITSTWDAERQAAHNDILQSNDYGKIMEHVTSIKAEYTKEYGREPSVTVKGSPAGNTADVYKDTYQMRQDMMKPEYKESEAFRQEVRDKLSRSNLFTKQAFK